MMFLHHFQQYFSQITVTAHITHVLPGFTSTRCGLSVLSISGHQCVLRPDFEKKRQHFESRTFFLRPHFERNIQEFQPRRFSKNKRKKKKKPKRV